MAAKLVVLSSKIRTLRRYASLPHGVNTIDGMHIFKCMTVSDLNLVRPSIHPPLALRMHIPVIKVNQIWVTVDTQELWIVTKISFKKKRVKKIYAKPYSYQGDTLSRSILAQSFRSTFRVLDMYLPAKDGVELPEKKRYLLLI